MINKKWDEIENYVKERWDQITDEDFRKARGDINKLKSIIASKYELTSKQIKVEYEKAKKHFLKNKKNIEKDFKDDATILGYEMEDKIDDLKDDATILKYEAEDKINDSLNKIKNKLD